MLTHSLAVLGGLLVGVLIGIVGSNGTKSSDPQPPASPATTGATAEAPPPARTMPETTSETTGTAKAAAGEIPGDGTFLVGQEVRPGTYRSAGPASSGTDCYWARLKGTTGDSSDTLANNAGKGPATVTILASDKAFQTSGCTTWKRMG
ncbi:hypothetical protein ACIGW4_37875 [Streptomyces sp. NPDC053513]|uniref:hypothetical protein n=1 Tax=unclassified Streptomyces TaxID=2593676 RepID=UPI0037D95281